MNESVSSTYLKKLEDSQIFFILQNSVRKKESKSYLIVKQKSSFIKCKEIFLLLNYFLCLYLIISEKERKPKVFHTATK